MWDFSVPNERPGPCGKCKGTGKYRWGAIVNGRPSKEGDCNSCRGRGEQTAADIARNNSYNRHKLAEMPL